MKLTVLGLYAPYPPAGAATSGYLLSGGGTNVLLDCGSGVISRLQSFVSLDDIDAVVLSHLHGDHMADIMVLRYMHGYRRHFGMGEKEGVAVFAPDKPEMEYAYLNSVRFFDVRPLYEGMEAKISSMTLKFFKMEHPYPCFGVRAECDGKVFAYSGDTVMNENISPMIKDVDLFLCDSSFLEADRTEESSHMSAAQAARLCAGSGVKRLILTHRLTHYDNTARHLSEAKYIFENAELAEEMRTFEF
jgi:ribonuclease BN (tRNA processing enzyme)